MNLQPILAFAHSTLEKAVKPGDIVVDATVGNGHDTRFLAKLVGPSGHVYGFDIQEKAINQTKERLEQENLLNRTTLFQMGHEHVKKMIPEQHHSQITGAIFNLGYLPRGDKQIVTKPETTISAVEQLLNMILPGGIIVLVVYHGHKGGEIERDHLLTFTTSLSQEQFHVLHYSFINQKNNPPFVIAIEKREN